MPPTDDDQMRERDSRVADMMRDYRREHPVQHGDDSPPDESRDGQSEMTDDVPARTI